MTRTNITVRLSDDALALACGADAVAAAFEAHGAKVERVSSWGMHWLEPLAEIDGLDPPKGDDKTLWTRALAEDDPLLRGALDRFCRSLGSVAGDLALAHGPGSVVIAGGLGLRLAEFLPTSGFAERFCAKGRYEPLMATIPVRIITHPEPGLFGAAAAFAREHLS